jgi:hypothetical protein
MAYNRQADPSETAHLLGSGATSEGDAVQGNAQQFPIQVPGTAGGMGLPKGYKGYNQPDANIMQFPPSAADLRTGSNLIRVVTSHLNKIVNTHLNEDVTPQTTFDVFNYIVTLANRFNLSPDRVHKLTNTQITEPNLTGAVPLNAALHAYMKQLDAAIKQKEFPRSWLIAIAQGVGAIKEGCATPRQGITNTRDKCCAGPHSPGTVCLNITGWCPVCISPCDAPISQNTCSKVTYNHIILIVVLVVLFIALAATGQFSANGGNPTQPGCFGNVSSDSDFVTALERYNQSIPYRNTSMLNMNISMLNRQCPDFKPTVNRLCPDAVEQVQPSWELWYFINWFRKFCMDY